MTPNRFLPESPHPTLLGSRVRVKICGFTSFDNALEAIDLGVDALGFNFYSKSKRALRFPEDLDWIAKLPNTAEKVAVIVNADATLRSGLEKSGVFHFLQFHGDETVADCSLSSLPWVKALPAGGDPVLSDVWKTPFLLFDAVAAAGQYGGTGRLADWKWIADFVRSRPQKNILLAGGLDPKNVRLAIETVRPFAVDVAGGVESSPGKKDRNLMAEFLKQASV